jgi:hypothetical protein
MASMAKSRTSGSHSDSGLSSRSRPCINDAGAQVDVLARSAYLRYREALGEPVGSIPEGLYPGRAAAVADMHRPGRVGRDVLDVHDRAAGAAAAIGQPARRRRPAGGARILHQRRRRPGRRPRPLRLPALPRTSGSHSDSGLSSRSRPCAAASRCPTGLRYSPGYSPSGMIREDLAALGIRHDVFFSERTLQHDGAVAKLLARACPAGRGRAPRRAAARPA